MNQSEHIFQRALLSANPQAILGVAQAFEELGDGMRAQLLLEHANAVMGGGFSFGADHVGFGADYAAIQAKLNSLGASPPLTVDGAWGPMSKAALVKYQTAHGLTADGIPGPITLGSLGLSGGTPGASTTPSGPSSPVIFKGQLPNKATPMTGEDVTKAISAGYRKIIGKNPTPGILNLLVSQAAFETGNFGKGIHNYNFGNKKFSSGDPYFQTFRCNEFINGVEVWDDNCKFAAYDNPADAGAAFIKLLQGRPHWWAGLQSGDSTTFVQALSTQPKYFTGDPTVYLAGLNRYFIQYAALAQKYAGAASVGVGVFLALAGAAAFVFRKKLGF
jgi:hypothetical protein